MNAGFCVFSVWLNDLLILSWQTPTFSFTERVIIRLKEGPIPRVCLRIPNTLNLPLNTAQKMFLCLCHLQYVSVHSDSWSRVLAHESCSLRLVKTAGESFTLFGSGLSLLCGFAVPSDASQSWLVVEHCTQCFHSVYVFHKFLGISPKFGSVIYSQRGHAIKDKTLQKSFQIFVLKSNEGHSVTTCPPWQFTNLKMGVSIDFNHHLLVVSNISCH